MLADMFPTTRHAVIYELARDERFRVETEDSSKAARELAASGLLERIGDGDVEVYVVPKNDVTDLLANVRDIDSVLRTRNHTAALDFLIENLRFAYREKELARALGIDAKKASSVLEDLRASDVVALIHGKYRLAPNSATKALINAIIAYNRRIARKEDGACGEQGVGQIGCAPAELIGKVICGE